MAKFCSSCGAQVDDAAKFCMGCGTPAAGAPAPTPEPVPIPAPQTPMPQPVPVPAPAPMPQPQQPEPQPQMAYQGRLPQQPVTQPYPQYPQQLQQYQQPYAPTPPPTPVKKKRRGLKIFLGIVGAFVAIIVVIVAAAAAITSSAAKKDYYELGNDKIPSVKLVLGEKRKITYARTSVSDGQVYHAYQYEVSTRQAEEMQAYVAYLLGEEDFYTLPEEEGTEEAFAILGRNSVDEGQCIVIAILCDDTGYALTVLKDSGQITGAGYEEGDGL